MQLASVTGNTQARIECDLGLSQRIISRWKRQLKSDGEYAFPGKGSFKPKDQESRDLKLEIQRLRQEHDILKKAVAIFSEDPYRYSDLLMSNALFGVLRRCTEYYRCLAASTTDGASVRKKAMPLRINGWMLK